MDGILAQAAQAAEPEGFGFAEISMIIGAFAGLVSILGVGLAGVWRLATINTKIETLKSEDIPFIKSELSTLRTDHKTQTNLLHEKINENSERITRLEK